MLNRIKSWFGLGPLTDQQFEQQRRELVKKMPIPVFWLFGKTGSGKSSIVRYLTGTTLAEIGNGFQPQTKTSFRYDFPSADAPLVRFLDTRGLGEAGYDPAEDLQSFDSSTHVIIVVARVMDHALAEVINPAAAIIRAARPSRPIVLALTSLHEAYPFEQHPVPDPFEAGQAPFDPAHRASDLAIHAALQRSLREQEDRFAGLVDRIIPIDLTKLEEGFDQPNFGGKRLEGDADRTTARRLPPGTDAPG